MVLTIALLILGGVESYGGATLQPPAGWERTESKAALSFQKSVGATYGQIVFYPGRKATPLGAEKEFEIEWQEIIGRPVGIAKPETRSSPQHEDGVTSLVGVTNKSAPAGTTMTLHVLLNGASVFSVRTATNDPKEFGTALEEFVQRVRLPAVTTPSIAKTAPAVVASGDPEVSTDAAGIPGSWIRSFSAWNGTAYFTDGSYIRTRYDFREDGTFMFRRESWQKLTPDDFWFRDESGTWKVDGSTLIVSPKKSAEMLKTREGKTKKTTSLPLEEVRYRWHFRYFSGIKETDLILKAPQETKRDGPFSSNGLEPESYLYSPARD